MTPTNQLCKSKDDFIHEQFDKGIAIWVATLSNGETIYQDDLRPNAYPHSAWLRLKTYLRENRLRISKLWLEFRSNICYNIVPPDADGYFFCKSALGIMHSPETMHFYLIGHLTNGVLKVQRWSVPALIHMECEDRCPDTVGDGLIINHG